MKNIPFVIPLLFIANLAFAADLPVQVSNAWARPTPGGSHETAVYLDIKNSGGSTLKLTKIMSSAGVASMHESMEHDGMMHMMPLEDVEIASGETVSFAPGHKHIMIEKLKTPLKSGDKIELTMAFDNGGSTKITVPVTEQKN